MGRELPEIGALARWPSRGGRRRLDAQWAQALQRNGMECYLGELAVPTPLELPRAIEQFNAGLFWESHETLEELWGKTPYPLRILYHALIKAAAGFHHLSRHNAKGARAKLSEARDLLHLCPAGLMGVPTDLLHQELDLWLRERLDFEGPLDWGILDRLPRARIHLGHP